MSMQNFNDFIKKWEVSTEIANKFFNKNEHGKAASFYEQSLFYSEMMFRHAQEADRIGIHVISPFSVSCINMANNFRASEDFGNASAYFMYNVWQLKMLSKREGITETLYHECVKNWEKAVMELTIFHQEINEPLATNFWEDKTYTQIQHAKAVIGMQNINMN